jgi:hypothetical protein
MAHLPACALAGHHRSRLLYDRGLDRSRTGDVLHAVRHGVALASGSGGRRHAIPRQGVRAAARQRSHDKHRTKAHHHFLPSVCTGCEGCSGYATVARDSPFSRSAVRSTTCVRSRFTRRSFARTPRLPWGLPTWPQAMPTVLRMRFVLRLTRCRARSRADWLA